MNHPLRCVAFGHRVRSDIALPGALPDDRSDPPDIVIRRLPPRAHGAEVGRSLWREGDTLHFVPHGVAAYRCTPPSTIDVTPCPDADEDEIAALLIASALPGLLWLRGAFMLHASAVILPGHDRAVAVAAPSGVGKSTVLAELAAGGARVLADDSLCLRRTAPISASGLPGGYFAYHPDPTARPFVPVDPDLVVEEAPLGAILLLSRHAADEPASFRRLEPWAALSGILSHRHRAAIPALFGEPARRLDDAVRIARTPTHRWSRPTGSIRLTAMEWRAMSDIIGKDNND